MSLNNLYTKKQIEILKDTRRSDWFMLINHGAKRSGKTILDNDLFLQELLMVKQTADRLNISTPQYILSGYTLGNIQDNILTELSNKYGIEFKFDKYNNFHLFGVKVVQTGHGLISGIGRIRGMTAFGAYVNEASLANPEVFDEIKARCSGPGARIICDTNPDHPEHWLLKDYIKSNARGIISYQFRLDDNTFLDQRYIDNIKETTPDGMFYDRGINGLWVSGKGVVYPDFDQKVHVITTEEANQIQFERFIAGVDWGWEHNGSIVVIGILNNAYYVIEEHAHQHWDVAEKWVPLALRIMNKYDKNMPFYCDTARTEHISKFVDSGINAIYANKRVLDGIETLAMLMKNRKFFINYQNSPRFKEEIYSYVWNIATGEPKKVFDDVLDAIRYAIYSDIQNSKVEPVDVKETINRMSKIF